MCLANSSIIKGRMLKTQLISHPATPCPAIYDFSVSIDYDSDGNLHLSYYLFGELSGIRIPPPLTPSAKDGLWQQTCFEAFIASENQNSYYEFNFSPSGQYAAYAFRDYRIRRDWLITEDIPINFTKIDEKLVLQTTLSSINLPISKVLQLGLSAVLETHNGKKSYWALHHPAATPDFHHRDSLTLAINQIENNRL